MAGKMSGKATLARTRGQSAPVNGTARRKSPPGNYLMGMNALWTLHTEFTVSFWILGGLRRRPPQLPVKPSRKWHSPVTSWKVRCLVMCIVVPFKRTNARSFSVKAFSFNPAESAEAIINRLPPRQSDTLLESWSAGILCRKSRKREKKRKSPFPEAKIRSMHKTKSYVPIESFIGKLLPVPDEDHLRMSTGPGTKPKKRFWLDYLRQTASSTLFSRPRQQTPGTFI